MTLRTLRVVSLLAAVGATAPLLTARMSGQGPIGGAASEGKPTVLGQWEMTGGAGEAGYSFEGGRIDIETKIMGVQSVQKTIVVDPADGKLPYQPWALAERNRRWAVSERATRVSKNLDSQTKCFPNGMPHVMYRSGISITQHANFVLMRFEWDHQSRVIYTDGRPHLPGNVKLWYGDSRGRWDGETLVVDVRNLNGYSWLSVVGDFITDEAQIVERFTPLDADTLQYRATVTDPHVYTRPWTMEIIYRAAGSRTGGDAGPLDGEIVENTCREGNRNLVWRTISPRSFAPEWRLPATQTPARFER